MMKLRLQPWIYLSLLLMAACDPPGKNERRTEEETGPEVTRSSRPPREVAPDKKAGLRAALDQAVMSAEPEERDKLLAQVAWNAMELDPELAREAFEGLMLESPERIALLQHFAMRMADEDPDAALAWAATLESEREVAAARARIALVIADDDPAKGANLLSEFGLANRDFDVAVVQVLQRWSGKSPQDAAAWVATFPPGEFRKAGVETVVSGWLGNNPQAAFAWISAVLDEQVRMEAGDAMAKKFLQQSPETQEAWLKAADPQIREKLTHARRYSTE